MKILSPVSRVEEVEKVIKAGADEIYCGVLSPKWRRKYTNVACINRREYEIANFRNYDELKNAVKISHSYGVPVFLCMNAFYTEEQYPIVLNEIEKAISIGVDAFIVADLGLMFKLKEMGIKFHVSTGGTTFNSLTAKFYKKMGATRIILDRHLTIQERKSIMKVKGIEFETFILNTRCINIDGFCTFLHGITEIKNPLVVPFLKRLGLDFHVMKASGRFLPLGKLLMASGILGSTSACKLCYKFKVNNMENKRGKNIESIIFFKFVSQFGIRHCGACTLFDLKKIGMHGVKIVGREFPTKQKIRDTQFIKNSLSLLKDKGIGKEEFQKKVREEFKKTYGYWCRPFECYYPDSVVIWKGLFS